MDRRSRVLVLIVTLVVAGCAVTTPSPPPRQAASPDATQPPVVTQPPAPSVPAGLERFAENERDGVRLTLELESAPLQLGVETWATMTVENAGADSVFYLTDGCEIPMELLAHVGGDWVGGNDQLGVAAEFKRLALFGDRSGDSHLLMGFKPEQHVGRDGGCADVGVPHELAAGERLSQRALWEPWEDAPIPSVPVTLEASFPFSGRHRDSVELDPVQVQFDSWITSMDTWPWLTPAQAVDAALADPTFFAWLHEVPSRTWINAHLSLDAEKGIWEVGLFRDDPGSAWAKIVKMDASSGAVIPEPLLNTQPPLRCISSQLCGDLGNHSNP